jgi:hypothetical protein
VLYGLSIGYIIAFLAKLITALMRNMKPELMSTGYEIELQEVKIQTIAPEGLGYGEGTIGVQSRIDSGDLRSETVSKVKELVYDPRLMAVAEANDDGCGDGRGVASIVRGEEVLNKSLHRRKVFGGGVVKGGIALIGTGDIDPDSIDNFTDIFATGASILKDKGVDFGAHTSTHANHEKTDCGAIDKAPLIIINSIKFEENIKENLAGLFDPEDLDILVVQDIVFDNLRELVRSSKDGHRPTIVINDIVKAKNMIVKELKGEHKEIRTVINIDNEDLTVDQGLIRAETNEEAQVFAVDVPRMKYIARKMFEGDLSKQKQAVVSMLIYTLATAATLTEGDLPVDIVYQDKPYIAF